MWLTRDREHGSAHDGQAHRPNGCRRVRTGCCAEAEGLTGVAVELLSRTDATDTAISRPSDGPSRLPSPGSAGTAQRVTRDHPGALTAAGCGVRGAATRPGHAATSQHELCRIHRHATFGNRCGGRSHGPTHVRPIGFAATVRGGWLAVGVSAPPPHYQRFTHAGQRVMQRGVAGHPGGAALIMTPRQVRVSVDTRAAMR